MFKVQAYDLESYFAADPARAGDLRQLDALICAAAPTLERHFHAGRSAGEAGMRMSLIGYGAFHYAIASGKTGAWPIIGVALQKNYISVYVAVTLDDAPLVDSYAGRLGELRSGSNNFSFRRFAELDVATVSALVREAERIFRSDPDNPVRAAARGT